MSSGKQFKSELDLALHQVVQRLSAEETDSQRAAVEQFEFDLWLKGLKADTAPATEFLIRQIEQEVMK